MTKRDSGKLEITESSGNVFADLELRHPESLMRKSTLLIEIELEIRRLGISRKVAAARMNLPEETLANMMRGQFNNIAERRIKEFLIRLGGREQTDALSCKDELDLAQKSFIRRGLASRRATKVVGKYVPSTLVLAKLAVKIDKASAKSLVKKVREQ